MRKENIELVVASELELTTTPNGISAHGVEVTDPLFVNLPLMTENKVLEQELLQRYQTGDLATLMPVKPFLGAKNMLAVLRNDMQREQLEAILRSQMSADSLGLIRAYLPESWPIFRHTEPPTDEHFLIKESLSSGAKGVVFAGEATFERRFKEAQSRSGTFIMQKKVPTKRRVISFFEPTTGQLERGEFNMRIVVYFLNGVPAEAVVTACDSDLVHGGKQAVNLGVALG